MASGNCHLCGQFAELKGSHVWPRFGYKRYVANQSSGGSFVDLLLQDLSNRQYKRPWFCQACEGRINRSGETDGARFCDDLDKRPTEPHPYGEWLLPFVTSITFRVAKLICELRGIEPRGRLREGMRRWKDCLLGKDKGRPLLPYSQHLFVVFAEGVKMHRAMGGDVFFEEGLVLSQFGPLFIAGLFDRRPYSARELKVWDASEVGARGGTVTPVSEWRAGRGGNVTIPFAELLRRQERKIVRQLRDRAGRGKHVGTP